MSDFLRTLRTRRLGGIQVAASVGGTDYEGVVELSAGATGQVRVALSLTPEEAFEVADALRDAARVASPGEVLPFPGGKPAA